MTAFARKQGNCGRGVLVWEIRSVNHRYLEPGIRLPDVLRSLEPAIRDSLRKHIARGKVDCQLRLETSDALSSALQINEEVVVRLNEASGQILSLTGGGPALTVMEILKWPGVLSESEAVPEDLEEKALSLFNEALSDLIETRRREGHELHGFISKRIDAVREIVKTVRVRMPEILARQQQVLRDRLAELKIELDPARLEQEIVIYAQKCDIDEELDRLETHLNEVERVLRLAEPSGRRLDFLMQELNREANTLSSKSIVAETTLNAVDLKVLIEQMREQIQNIE
ncbi:MAG: YicC/YloC family endoribonuclease [Gammaproteobacteria bacterium]|nr:YicC/YloC family endoribonuclease [Gammaproteobacteria bacterium]MDP2139563.1 YicC/YloC family endoribonuclease [Gammaproteobacteria bacterium]MDP2346536.1 YicC/YloC family endoribonuclease [Gammaproteobacteria bacterium]